MMDKALIPFAAPPPPTLIDSRGRPLRTAVDTLKREIAAPTIAGVRSILSGHPAQGLDPVRLTQILLSAEQGDATAYLELAEEMEEKDLHYQSVLGTRKRAVSQLPIEVEAAGDSTEEEGDAQLLRGWLKRMTLQAELFDMLDAIGKGYSATEIIWGTSTALWLPETLKLRDPRFFEFDRVTGEQLMLKGGIDGTSGLPQPLPSYKFITHLAPAKSGQPIRGGIARAAAWGYLFKNFTLKDWMTFLEVYGLPLRVGKYQNGTSEDDIRRLAQAVAQIGSDAGAVIPASMMIEFVTSNGGHSNPEMFQALCTYCDDQLSKAVLGQTSSADAKAGGLGSGQADLHGEVRHDIECADAVLLSATLTRDLAVPMVMFNRGVRARYPMIKIGRPDSVDVKAAIEAIDAGLKAGVPIGVSYFRKVTGIPEPEPGEALLSAPVAAPVAIDPENPATGPAGNGSGGNVPKTTPPALLEGSLPSLEANGGTGAGRADGEVAALYNPNQPRVPRGSANGGEWRNAKGGFGGAGAGAPGGGRAQNGPAKASGPSKPNKLTPAESRAIGDYSLMEYKTINEQARGEVNYGPKVDRKIEVMDRAVGKGVLAEPTTLYRGVSGEGVKALMASGISEGSVIRDPGFLSTSRSPDIVKHNFADQKGAITLKISAKKGTRALDAAKHSNLEFEQEVIFPRSTRLRVTKWDKRSRTLHVEVHDD